MAYTIITLACLYVEKGLMALVYTIVCSFFLFVYCGLFLFLVYLVFEDISETRNMKREAKRRRRRHQADPEEIRRLEREIFGEGELDRDEAMTRIRQLGWTMMPGPDALHYTTQELKVIADLMETLRQEAS